MFRKVFPFAVDAGAAGEREVAAEIVVQTLRAGSDAILLFPPIVASGPNSTLPHAFVTDRVLRLGDLLTLNWGMGRWLPSVASTARRPCTEHGRASSRRSRGSGFPRTCWSFPTGRGFKRVCQQAGCAPDTVSHIAISDHTQARRLVVWRKRIFRQRV
jgi:hypothetical protein